MSTTDERCARCGNPLPGANPNNLDACVPCETIVSLEVERDELLAEVKRLQPMQDGEHHYLSTYCLHERHRRCRLVCKVCESPCRCDCHKAEAGGP